MATTDLNESRVAQVKTHHTLSVVVCANGWSRLIDCQVLHLKVKTRFVSCENPILYLDAEEERLKVLGKGKTTIVFTVI